MNTHDIDPAQVLENFAITGPDADGLVWLILHGNGTSGRAMFNLGSLNRASTQVALELEKDRQAAIEADRKHRGDPVPVPSDDDVYAIWTQIVATHLTLTSMVPAFARALLARYGAQQASVALAPEQGRNHDNQD